MRAAVKAIFDDSRLESRDLSAGAENLLRRLAGEGARIRRVGAQIDGIGSAVEHIGTPRGVLVVGAEARFIRAVLEPLCPVPIVAWSLPHLPAWVGPLDLVVGVDQQEIPWDGAASLAEPSYTVGAVREAARRGAAILVATAEDSPAWRTAGGASVRVPVCGDDPLAAAVAVLAVLGRLGLGPQIDPDQVGRAADMIAEESSPFREMPFNRAKELACAMADATPLLWGGSVLAARSARRVAEALRRATGEPALCADAAELLPVICSSDPRDPFSDPEVDGPQQRPVLLIMDDHVPDPRRAGLEEVAQRFDVPVHAIDLPLGVDEDSDPVRTYVTLLMQGRYMAAYVALGLGRLDDVVQL